MKQEESWENRVDPLFLARSWEMGSSQISESKFEFYETLKNTKKQLLGFPREPLELQIQRGALIVVYNSTWTFAIQISSEGPLWSTKKLGVSGIQFMSIMLSLWTRQLLLFVAKKIERVIWLEKIYIVVFFFFERKIYVVFVVCSCTKLMCKV